MVSIYLTPDNIRYLASNLHPTANIKSRLIHFSPGNENDLLIEIPLGPHDTRTVYVVTVGLEKSHLNTKRIDADLGVGISDGTNSNVQLIVDVNDYDTYPPCYPLNGSSDHLLVSPGTKVPSVFKFIFFPFYKYTACETGQEGGYINTGSFNAQIDVEKPIFLRVFRHNATEQVYIHYLKLETF